MTLFGLFGKKTDPAAPPVPVVTTAANTSATVAATVTLSAPVADAEAFAGYKPLPGLETLGRHITDANGAPSGSPANFEALRGARTADDAPSRQTIDAAISKLLKEFGRG
ncbi:MAG: hypothetical protein KGL39_05425 [Patescibacteria group bacterium]|nr:hypothetical protein [Patescibacteria group bacterium]